jgi:glutaminyl-peptide cyclotransferase
LTVALVTAGLLVACTGRTTAGAGRPATGTAAAPGTAGTATTNPAAGQAVVPERLRAVIVARYPHDPTAFTQGLALVDGMLFESTGLEGRSDVRQVDLDTGAVRRRWALPADVFGEGLAVAGDRLVVLTWRSGRAFVLDRASFTPGPTLVYDGEGWGLCHDGDTFVQSDGTARLTRRDPGTFEPLSTIAVRDGMSPVTRLNELECVAGSVYANVWQTSRIARIDPATGTVTAWIDASALVPQRAGADPDDVLNGIAHDPTDGTFLLAGKRWDVLYRVRFEP